MLRAREFHPCLKFNESIKAILSRNTLELTQLFVVAVILKSNSGVRQEIVEVSLTIKGCRSVQGLKARKRAQGMVKFSSCKTSKIVRSKSKRENLRM